MTIAAGAILFLLGLEAGASNTHDWSSAFTLCLIIFGVLLLVAFMIWEWKFAKIPIVPTRVFASRTSRAALAVACCHSFVFIAFDFFLALYFQVVLGRSPIISGLLLFALVLPLSACTFGTGIFVRRTGRVHPALWFGASFMTLGTGLFILFGRDLILWKIIVFQVIAGIGAGPLFQTPMIALQSQVKQRDVTAANSAFTFLRNLITSLSIVIGGVVLQKGLGTKSLVGDAGNAGESGRHVSAGEDVDAYASALSKMWIFYTAFCGVMLLSSFWVGKIDVNAGPGRDKNDDLTLEQTVIVEKNTESVLPPDNIAKSKIAA